MQSPQQLLDKWRNIDKTDNPHEYVDYLLQTRRDDNLDIEYLKQKYKFLALDKKLKILDVGCGTGFDIIRLVILSNMFDLELKVYGCENSQIMFNACQVEILKLGLHARVYMQDAYNMYHFTDNHFDRVFCRTLLQHLEKPDLALKEMIRVAKSGGTVTAIDTDWLSVTFDGFPLTPNAVPIFDQEVIKHIPSYNVAGKLPDIFKRLELKYIVCDKTKIAIPWDTHYEITQYTVSGVK